MPISRFIIAFSDFREQLPHLFARLASSRFAPSLLVELHVSFRGVARNFVKGGLKGTRAKRAKFLTTPPR